MKPSTQLILSWALWIPLCAIGFRFGGPVGGAVAFLAYLLGAWWGVTLAREALKLTRGILTEEALEARKTRKVRP